MNLRDITAHWVSLHEALGLGGPIRDEAHYEQLLTLVDDLMSLPEMVETSPMDGLLDLVSDRIREYEDRVHPWPDTSTPATRLAFLMDQHNLKQTDLREIGTQGVVSELLSGKRELNLRQAKALAARFSVSIDAIAG
jgi:HTH-type transcriptional regulator/antitoxin HigA